MAREADAAAVVLRSAQQFQGAERAERIEKVARDQVGARFAAREREQRHISSQTAREPSDRAPVLVVRMSRDVEDARGGAQAFEGLVETRRAAVFRKRLGGKQAEEGGGESEGDAKHSSNDKGSLASAAGEPLETDDLGNVQTSWPS